MNLVIDSGNSSAKIGIFDQHRLVKKSSFDSEEGLKVFVEQNFFEHVLISSVKGEAGRIGSWIKPEAKVYVLDRSLSLPVKNGYRTPETLGMDRLAAVCGAQHLYPGHDCLVIDAGTCITYEFIDAGGTYHGGSISPGLAMRFKAVHNFTAKLPLVSAKAGVSLIGDSTETSIQSGVTNGLIAEIEGICRQYQEKFPGIKVILCGGDAGFFENQLKASIFASPELVLIGLNSILIHNVNLP